MADPSPKDEVEADTLIARAIESVLDTVPELPGGDVTSPETSPKAQPWAETGAPAGRNKRPLDELLNEYAERVAASPNAVAGKPSDPHPAVTYLERLSPGSQQPGRRAGKRRWRGGRRRRGRRGGGSSA